MALSQVYILCCIEHFLNILLSSVHFVLYRALFAHPTLECTFCAVSVYKLNRNASPIYYTELKKNSLYSKINRGLGDGLAGQTALKHTFCAENGSCCTWHSQADIRAQNQACVSFQQDMK